MELLRKGKSMARYTEEFKREAVRLYKSGGPGVLKAAKGIGVAPESLRSWIKKHDDETRDLDISERERLRKAEAEVKRLKEENEILIKAAAFFAKETDRRK